MHTCGVSSGSNDPGPTSCSGVDVSSSAVNSTANPPSLHPDCMLSTDAKPDVDTSSPPRTRMSPTASSSGVMMKRESLSPARSCSPSLVNDIDSNLAASSTTPLADLYDVKLAPHIGHSQEDLAQFFHFWQMCDEERVEFKEKFSAVCGAFDIAKDFIKTLKQRTAVWSKMLEGVLQHGMVITSSDSNMGEAVAAAYQTYAMCMQATDVSSFASPFVVWSALEKTPVCNLCLDNHRAPTRANHIFDHIRDRVPATTLEIILDLELDACKAARGLLKAFKGDQLTPITLSAAEYYYRSPYNLFFDLIRVAPPSDSLHPQLNQRLW